MKKLGIPVVVEPGSQPSDEDGVVLDYMPMPKGVWTYAMPVVPEPEDVEGLDAGIGVLTRVRDALATYHTGDDAIVIGLDHLDAENRHLVDQVLGDGEVSVVFEGMLRAVSQESVLAGVWRVQYLDDQGAVERDVVEIAGVPSLVSHAVFSDAKIAIDFDAEHAPAGVANALPILTELADKLAEATDESEPHVINLSLLPCTDEDMEFLAGALGSGPAVILSRGYGNCRVTSTGTRFAWWVQYFNSQDALILNTLEISRVPAVVAAAPEDIEDSRARLDEILEVYR
jgi:hydrogenase-1 operon protein HyaF